MAFKVIAVKKYVVRLSKDERARLNGLVGKGKSPAKQQLKARILLKADVSRNGEGWSDSKIIEALNTSVSMVYRVRQQLVEEGLDAVLSRKPRATPAIARIFDGEKEAKLMTLACSRAPAGQVRWTLNHHEARVFHFSLTDVERLVLHPDHPTRHIHHKANTIGSGHAAEDHDYLHATAESIADAGAVLITGPANAKTELVKHIHHHDPKLMNVIVGVETVHHPSDAQLVAYARKYFNAADRMQPQKP